MDRHLNIVILGLSITSSWGNGHATTYRGLVRELVRRGHEVCFLERDVPWYAENRDLPEPPYGTTSLYMSLQELQDCFARDIHAADVVIVGSYVPEGVAVGQWVLDNAGGCVAFYDIDTPVTLAKIEKGDYVYISPELISRYDLYLSFTGGPILTRIERELGSPMARALYCSVDTELYYPEPAEQRWDLGYLGTYSDDRQPVLDELLIKPAQRWSAGRFIVAGPQYPNTIRWPDNVQRAEHIPPSEHRAFYSAQRFSLNITRADMARAGYAPSVRIFEAVACATPVISDWWQGLDTLLTPGKEIIIARTAQDVLSALQSITEDDRRQIGERARQRILAEHTSAHRAAELEQHILEALEKRTVTRSV